MQYALLNFLRSALIPVLRSDITAGASCNIHFGLVGIAAFRAFPDELAVLFNYLNFYVIAAFLTLVGFRIQLCIHDIVIDKFHHLKYSLYILLHIRNLDI